MTPLEIYSQKFGARLFPLRKRERVGDSGCKRPLVDRWQSRTFSRDELLDFWAKGHPIGWALGPGDLVVDVDAATKDRPDKKGPESLRRLEVLLGSPLESATIEVLSPSGGRHFYLTKPKETQIRKTLEAYPGIEFIGAGGYVVIAGSPHWQGGTYRFSELAELMGDFGRAEAPPGLMDLIRKDPEVAIDEAQLPEAISGDLLARILEELDPTSYRAYDDWRKILFSAHSATGGSDEGLEVFAAWCAKDPEYAEAGPKVRELWRAIKKKTGITIATLFGELKDLGKVEVLRLVRASMDFAGTEAGPKPLEKVKIRYELNEVAVNDAMIQALSRAKGLYQRAGALVQISDEGFSPVGPISLCEIASEVCDLLEYKEAKGGGAWRPVRIPERIGRQVVARGSWFGIPSLRSVTGIPVFTSAGVLQTPGYHAESGVFYRRSIEVPAISTRPTRREAREALDRLADVVVDFPFASRAHRSVWLAAFLAVLARPAIEGPLPLFFIVGNQPGVGKSLLVNTISRVLFGTDAPRSTLSSSDEETRKELLAAALRNDNLMLFDNCANGSEFGSPVLDAVLTSRTVRGRLLGQSKLVDAGIETVFFATGNRLRPAKGSDSVRRLAFCSLTYPEENPKGRSGFRHGSDEAFGRWLMVQRPALIAAGLTVLQAAKAAEAELPEVRAWGSYAAFSEVVRRALVWLGEPDPIETQDELAAMSEEENEVAIVVDGIRKAIGLGVPMSPGKIVAALRAAAEPDFDSGQPEEIREAAKAAEEALAPPYLKDGISAAGKRLSTKFRERPVGGFWIRTRLDAHSKNHVYWVEATGKSSEVQE